jgi:hypothetical protein
VVAVDVALEFVALVRRDHPWKKKLPPKDWTPKVAALVAIGFAVTIPLI